MFKRAILFSVVCCLAAAVHGAIPRTVTAHNPSEAHERTITVKAALPDEVAPDDILDDAGMTLRYDDRKGQYYLTKEVTLKPGETKTFLIQLEDIWMVNEKTCRNLQTRARELAEQLRETKYEEEGNALRRQIADKVDRILERQEANTVPPASLEEHFSAYDRNRQLLETARKDLAELKSLMAISGDEVLIREGAPETPPPNLGTIWKVIFIIISFVAVISIVLFVVWAAQLQKVREAESLAQNTDADEEPSNAQQ